MEEEKENINFIFLLFLICTSTLSGGIDNHLYPIFCGLYSFIQFHIFRVQNLRIVHVSQTTFSPWITASQNSTCHLLGVFISFLSVLDIEVMTKQGKLHLVVSQQDQSIQRINCNSSRTSNLLLASFATRCGWLGSILRQTWCSPDHKTQRLKFSSVGFSQGPLILDWPLNRPCSCSITPLLL